MCRHLAYVGAQPVALRALLVDAPHALVDQARAPRFQTSGDDNPDGYGVAWYPAPGAPPQRYRTPRRMWEDVDGLASLDGVEATAVVAAARLASPGAPVEESGNAPFVAGVWSFSLNGVVDGFREGVADELRARTSAERLDAIEGESDSEVLFALALDALAAGAEPTDALARVIGEVTARTTARLNLLLTDGRRLVASVWGNSLFVGPPGLVASEPLDDGGAWRRVDDRSLVVTDGDDHAILPLPIGAR